MAQYTAVTCTVLIVTARYSRIVTRLRNHRAADDEVGGRSPAADRAAQTGGVANWLGRVSTKLERVSVNGVC
jgi:hypothetical protein